MKEFWGGGDKIFLQILRTIIRIGEFQYVDNFSNFNSNDCDKRRQKIPNQTFSDYRIVFIQK